MAHLRFIYCSTLTDSPGCIPTIVKKARKFNMTYDITGILIFDGEKFCQYIEGPLTPMTELIERIYNDSRHTNIIALLNIEGDAERLFSSWNMAYALIEEQDYLQIMADKQGVASVAYLQELTPLLDIN